MAVYRRMTAGPLVGPTPLEEPESILVSARGPGRYPAQGLSLADEAGTTYTSMFRPPSWRFARAPDPEDDPRHPAFQRVDPRSPVAATDGELDDLLDECWAVKEEVEEMEKTATGVAKDVLVGELDILKKITHQRGWLEHRILAPMVVPQLDVPGGWIDTLHRVLKTYKERYIESDIPESPFDTNPGWPAFQTGFCGKALSALFFWDLRWQQVQELSYAFADKVSMPEALVMGYGLNFRQGPRYKDEPDLTHVGGGQWEATHAWRGAWPRNRRVYMGAYGGNLALEGLLRVLQGGRRGIEGLWHQGEHDNRAVMRADMSGWRIQESDISGLDQNVSRTITEAIGAALKLEFPTLSDEVDVWMGLEAQPTIGPARDKASGCTAWYTLGGVHSGIRLTAEIDTLITVTTSLWVLSQMLKKDAVNVWKQSDMLLLISGDDVLTGQERELDPDEWSALWALVGLSNELTIGRRFLMRHMIGLADLPVGGRILQQTVSNEHEPRGVDREILALSAFVARYGSGPHKLMVDLVDRVVRMTGFARRWRIEHGHEARARLDSPEGREAIEQALKRLANDPWLIQLMRDAPYRPSAAAELKLLRELGIPIEQPDLSLAIALKRELPRVGGLTSRLRKAVALWELIQTGSDSTARGLEILRLA